MTPTEIVGAVAATLTTLAFVPQALKALRDKDTRALSLRMYATFTTGVLLWGLYGYMRNDWVVIAANAITAVLCLAILISKLRNDVFGARRDPLPPTSAPRD
jgi:MtN3 and saliva related transmembrane protein